ncbi:alpha-galactosidase [Butyrivibrio proteoclasticus]|uniref:Alpha-galactosidase n=1 Tax=Butyrivibrio proteoclasticus TaxID=43305 RepID=A0A1I5U4C0_9FIRM|nr:glycoside hydrolase family 27 protein [Butyrivibrio proteoclasticus]SFP90090.1 alpha-galactosidase [Butyrivibrio proteoclasticus]
MGYENLRPDEIESAGRFDSFDDGKVMFGKQKNKLPAMGWNSWNAFGSGNTEALTKIMADKFIELGLDKLGYKYIILDDGCYKTERVEDKLSNEDVKFPSGFKALSDYIHERGLKFGMYNDIGTNLCAGAQVGTCGHEAMDAANYIEWGVDFLKVDNCYYPFDNATFSNAENARYTFAPNIRAVKVCASDGSFEKIYSAVKDGVIVGRRAEKVNDDGYVTKIGTFDGTGPDATPVGLQSSELVFNVDVPSDGEYSIFVQYATGKEEGVGEWLQIMVEGEMIFDGFLKETESPASFVWSTSPSDEKSGFVCRLHKGINKVRIMNHRRQENTLNSYGRLLKELKRLSPDKDIYYSACEWGKTQPQNWGKKVCDSWRILNDITFRVGSDGDPGHGDWTSDYTTGVAVQYNKAVIMDEFAGLSKGWNDPDMLMIGMDGLNEIQCKTHMAMWCMMNSPLMLGLDLRRVSKGDWIYKIISNEKLISLNQDTLGIQAKRVYSSIAVGDPSKEYIRDNDRVDILVKPLSGERFAISFINVSEKDKEETFKITLKDILKAFADNEKSVYLKAFENAKKLEALDVYTDDTFTILDGCIEVSNLKAFDNITFIVSLSDEK